MMMLGLVVPWVFAFLVCAVAVLIAADAARIRQTAKSKDGFLRTVGMRVSLSDSWGPGIGCEQG